MQSRLGGTVRRVDSGGGAEQRHDFDLTLSSGETIAVEVTRHNLPGSLAVLSEVDKRDWRFPILGGVWVVDMIPVYNVGAVHREISAHLKAFEDVHIERLLLRGFLFDESLTADELDADERRDRELLRRTATTESAVRVYELGARLVYRLADAGPEGGEVVMSEASQASATGPSVVVDLVERHTARADNITKLSAASDRSERHLFIWVENSQHAAVATFAFSNLLPDGAHLPDRAPALPHCVDVVWAVTGYDNAHIWQYHRQHGWRDLGTWRREPSPATKD